MALSKRYEVTVKLTANTTGLTVTSVSTLVRQVTSIGFLTGPRGLQGAPGAAGPAGPTGSTGATGPAGVQGIQGVVGPQGSAGPAGAAGTAGAQGPTGPAGRDGIAQLIDSNGVTWTISISTTGALVTTQLTLTAPGYGGLYGTATYV